MIKVSRQVQVHNLINKKGKLNQNIVYLRNGELPERKTETCILRLKVARYILYDDKLYKRDYSMPVLKCISPLDASTS